MALPIRDGNQSLTTLSTILVSNSHIPAHTVVSLGAQAITDIATAVSGVELGPNTLNALENITVTLGQVTITGGLTNTQLRASPVTISGTVTANEQTEWVIIGTRDWKLDSSDWFLDVSGYSAIQLENSGDGSASIGNGLWVAGNGDVGCSNDFIIWNGRSVTTGLALADCVFYETNVKRSWVRFTGQEPSFGGNSVIRGRKSKILDGLTNYQLRESPISISGSVTANLDPIIFGGGSGTQTNYAVQIGFYDNIDNRNKIVSNGNDVNSGLVALPVTQINPISGTVTANISNSVTIASLPSITGTVTASVINSITVGSLPVQLSTTTIGGTARLNVTLSSATTVGATAPSYANLYGGSDGTNLRAISVDSSGRMVVTGTTSIFGTPSVTFGTAVITGSTSIIGTPSITFGTISGTVTANITPLKVSPSFLTGTMTATTLSSVVSAGTRNYLRIQAMEGGSGSALLYISFNGTNDHAVLQTSVLQSSATTYPYAFSARSDTLEFNGSWVPQTEIWIRSSSTAGKPYSIIYA